MKPCRSKLLAKVIGVFCFLIFSTVSSVFSKVKECGCSVSGGGMTSVTYTYLSDNKENCCSKQSGAALAVTDYSFIWTTTIRVTYVSTDTAQAVCCFM